MVSVGVCGSQLITATTKLRDNKLIRKTCCLGLIVLEVPAYDRLASWF